MEAMTKREQRARTEVREWARYEDETLTELLERFAIAEIARWRRGQAQENVPARTRPRPAPERP